MVPSVESQSNGGSCVKRLRGHTQSLYTAAKTVHMLSIQTSRPAAPVR
jgi:hypothetical protein